MTNDSNCNGNGGKDSGENKATTCGVNPQCACTFGVEVKVGQPAKSGSSGDPLVTSGSTGTPKTVPVDPPLLTDLPLPEPTPGDGKPKSPHLVECPRPVAGTLPLPETDPHYEPVLAIVEGAPAPEFPATWRNTASAMIAKCLATPDAVLFRDSTGAVVTCKEFLGKAAAVAKQLSTQLDMSAEYVGIVIPPSVAGAVVNGAVILLGKIGLNVSYLGDSEMANYSIKACGIKDVVASLELLESRKITLEARVLNVKEVFVGAAAAEVQGFVQSAVTAPRTELPKFFPGLARKLSDTQTIVFTSGSTGNPKGVVLSQSNSLAQALAIETHFGLAGEKPVIEGDIVVLGTLPYNHGLGYEMLIVALTRPRFSIVFHSDPRDASTLGSLCETHAVNVFVTAPSLMRLYLMRLRKNLGVFKSLKILLLGSEKCPKDLSEDIVAKLGIEAYEAFGSSELSPLASSNTPVYQHGEDDVPVSGNLFGTVGFVIPGSSCKATDPATGAVVYRVTEAEEADGKTEKNQGLLWFKGPNVMQGYLNNPEATAKVIVDGWYCTGDMGYIRTDGRIVITGRLSRFSKIAGEMVSHGKVEEAVCAVTGLDQTSIFVGGVACGGIRGEKLVVLHRQADLDPRAVVAKLNERLASLWVPDASDFAYFGEEPFPIALSTGKTDIKALNAVIKEKFPPAATK